MTHRLLAINFGGIGDEILFLPVLASIKEAQPDTQITLLLEPRSKAITDITNLIDDVKFFDIKKRPLLPKDYLDLLQILRKGEYQTVISSGSSPLVACLLFASGIQNRIGYDSGPLSRLLLTKAIRLNKNQYASNMYHDLVQGLGLPQKDVIPKIQATNKHITSMQALIAAQDQNKKRIVIHPGTSKLAIQKGIIKTWPAHNWAELINKLLSRQDLQVILAGGPDDERTISEINQALNQKLETSSTANSLVLAYGKTKSLADLAALIQISDLLICVDSAPMHMGVSLHKPTLALFGPTKPAHLLPPLAIYRYLMGQHSIATGVQLQPDIVYQSALDLLEQAKVL